MEMNQDFTFVCLNLFQNIHKKAAHNHRNQNN